MRQSILHYGTMLFFLVLLQSLIILVRTSISDSAVLAVTHVAQEKRFYMLGSLFLAAKTG
ncbi:MAG: hypothetical protein ACSLEN_05960 [Candidatus Malihini olakiniferum]